MSKLEELVSPGRAAIITMEMQRGVIGDLSALRALADVVDQQDIPKRLGGMLDVARGAGVPVIHCRAAFRADRRGSYKNVPMVNHMLKNPDHMLIGEGASEVIPELGPAPDDLDSVRLHGNSPDARLLLGQGILLQPAPGLPRRGRRLPGLHGCS